MQLNRSYLFSIISSIALLGVLVIQVYWLLETAKIKESIFNDKANLVLSQVTQAIQGDSVQFKVHKIEVGQADVNKIDSLVKYYLNRNSLDLKYTFKLKTKAKNEIQPFSFNISALNTFELKGTSTSLISNTNACYTTCIGNDAAENPVELTLILPDKEMFIRAEMRWPFISAVALICLVLVLSWRAIIALNKEKRLAEETNDFINTVTHEFNTPLTNIGLAGKLMVKADTIKQVEKVRHYASLINAEKNKLSEQVAQLLSIAALERGEMLFEKSELDLHELIKKAIEVMRLQLEAKQGALKLSLNAKKHIIQGDARHLFTLILNLVDNALKYTSAQPYITIETRDVDDMLVLLVSDTGIGIPKKYQKAVFTKFFRVPTGNLHQVKGFGLGLAAIKTIVRLHKGKIKAQSAPNQGTCFEIKLPNGN